MSTPFKMLFKCIGLVMIIVIGYNFVKGLSDQTQSLAGTVLSPV
ncbi:hypothetical protein [Clostridium estertheticum]|nr:hypothetical protein [Clostridium estertheticum]